MEYLTHVTVLAGLAVVAIQQILKLKIVPVAFANKYPVITNIVLSIGASLYVVWRENIITPIVWTGWVQLIATISLVAAFAYNMTLRNSSTIKSLEG